MTGRQYSRVTYFHVEYCPLDYKSRPPVPVYSSNAELGRMHLASALMDGTIPLGTRVVDAEGTRWLVYEQDGDRVLLELECIDGAWLIKNCPRVLCPEEHGFGLEGDL